MKRLFTLILILFINRAYSQTATNTVAYNEKNIYYQALTQYVDFEKWNRGLTLDTVFIEDDATVTDSLLLQSGQTKFIKLKTAEIPNYLKAQKAIVLYRVSPLGFENGEFYVSFFPFLASQKKKRSVNDNAGCYRVVYKFDNNKFVFQRVEDHGI